MTVDHHDGGTVASPPLVTEGVDVRYARLDSLSTRELVRSMNDAEATVPGAVRAAEAQIAEAIEGIVERLSVGGRLFYVGAGTPGRLGVLDASECPPTFSTDPTLIQGVIAGGDGAFRNAVEESEDDESAGAADLLTRGLGAGDVVVGISASGHTGYVRGALRAAGAVGAMTIGLSCNAGSPVSALSDVAIEVLVGPEVLAGSTRLKAGSAQKQVLNMLSTASMVRLGKTYGNLMVDVRASNSKLRARAVSMVRRITGADLAVAERALEASDYSVRTAVVMIATDSDRQRAAALLAAAGGRLAEIVGEPPDHDGS